MNSIRKNKIIKAFTNNINNYDRSASIQKHVANQLAKKLPELTTPRILEVGCGSGFLTKILAMRYPYAKLDVTDISPEIISYTSQKIKHKNVQFFPMDGENINFDKSYDFIVSSMAFQWFDNPIIGINKLSEYGNIYYAVPGPNNFQEWRHIIKLLNLRDGTINMPKLPGIIEEEIIIKDYGDTRNFLNTLKNTGAYTAKMSYRPLSYKELKKAIESFDIRYKGKISWHITYGFIKKKEVNDF